MRRGLMDVVDGGSKCNLVVGSCTDESLSAAAQVMNFDVSVGSCSSQMGDLACICPLDTPSTTFSPFDVVNFSNQYHPGVTPENYDILGGALQCGDKVVYHQSLDNLMLFASDSTDQEFDVIEKLNKSSTRPNLVRDMGKSVIPRPLKRSLGEKLLTALHLFKEEAGGGILAQVWAPMKYGDQYILSTYEQPYLLDQTLSGYREVSRLFTFSAESKPGSFPGLPGRVFSSKIPEWTSNLLYYNKAEYLRIQYAADFQVRGSIGLPVFEHDSIDTSCCAVLELVTRKEKSNFDSEISDVCRVLQVVNLRSVAPPRLYHQSLSRSQRAALSDIADVMQDVCHTLHLPVALTWIPCSCIEVPGDEIMKVHRGCNSEEKSRYVLCVEDTACYVNDRNMGGFVHASLGHYLEEGQGVAGKALQSNHPFFYPDVKEYHISEYPLVHHARKFGLNAAVAIRLRSMHTGNDSYILEFFLPVNVTEVTEQQILLNSLSSTMQRICKSLRTVSDAELLEMDDSKVEPPTKIRFGIGLPKNGQGLVTEKLHDNYHTSGLPTTGVEDDDQCQKAIPGPEKQPEKKRNTTEKHVSLSVLQQYFSGSLKDAAKSIGVCPTTLKRICRQHGIARWPSRKINKVNRSLKKLQSVLDSVQGISGGLKLDSDIGGLVGTGVEDSISQENVKLLDGDFNGGDSDALVQGRRSAVKKKDMDIESTSYNVQESSCLDGKQVAGECKPSFCLLSSRLDEKLACSSDQNKLGWMPTKGFRQESMLNLSSRDPIPPGDDNGEMGSDIGLAERNQPASPRKTGLSNEGSSTFHSGSCSSSKSLQKHDHGSEESCGDYGSRVVVKASYKGDIVRFKFEPAAGCDHLYEEIATRFKLQVGLFQLKYLDDEDEWIMLVSDSDLQECVEVLGFQGTCHAKLLVCDVRSNVGSSGGSNSFLDVNC